jgi:2-phosphoglycerate kinase
MIIIREKKYKLPFSKGRLAKSLVNLGINPNDSYQIALKIENYLNKKYKGKIIPKEKLRNIVYNFLKNYDLKFADRYKIWHTVLNKYPIIILVSGASGIGTSTIGHELAVRLNIPSVIGTDVIREVMRKTISQELNPMLHESTYTAWKCLRIPKSKKYDIHILGYIQHSEPVLVGIEGIIDRALKEGLSMVIEGAHIIPWMMKEKYINMKNIIPLVVTVDSEDEHKKRFELRSKVSNRPKEKYLKHFTIIRKINDYLVKHASEYNIPVINNENLDMAIESALDIITERFRELIN